jgi:hypothetical protein
MVGSFRLRIFDFRLPEVGSLWRRRGGAQGRAPARGKFFVRFVRPRVLWGELS